MKGRNFTLVIAIYVVTLSGIGVDLYAPSLPHLASYFHIPVSTAKITISIFLFGFAFGQIIFGTLSDAIGRKPPLAIGIGLFCMASFIIVFSKSITLIAIMRFCQGLGTGATSSIGKVLISDTSIGKKFKAGMTYVTIVWSVGPIVAPIIGGYIQYYFQWQANFWIYGIYSLIMLIVILSTLSETIQHKTHIEYQTLRHNFWQVLSHPTFIACIIILGIGYSMIITFNVVGPFLIQDTLHYNAIVYGHVALIVGAAFFVGTSIDRGLVTFMHSRNIMQIGYLLIMFGSLLMLLFGYQMKLSIGAITIPIFITIVGTGLLFPNAIAKAMSLFPNISGLASSILGLMFVSISAISSAIISYLPHGTLIPIGWFFVILASISMINFYCLYHK